MAAAIVAIIVAAAVAAMAVGAPVIAAAPGMPAVAVIVIAVGVADSDVAGVDVDADVALAIIVRAGRGRAEQRSGSQCARDEDRFHDVFHRSLPCMRQPTPTRGAAAWTTSRYKLTARPVRCSVDGGTKSV